MNDTIENIELTIKKSNTLLLKRVISHEEYDLFKRVVESLMADIISNKNFSFLNDSVKSILERKLDNPNRSFIAKLILSLFLLKSSIHFNAPFLIRHSQTDNYKKYIFWTKFSLEGMLHRINMK